MDLDLTIHLGDIIMAAVALVAVPLTRVLIQMRDTLLEIAPKVKLMGERVDTHHDWLVSMRAKLGYGNGQVNGPRPPTVS